MAYATEVKEKVLFLRSRGYSIKELATQFRISKSTASHWVESIELDSDARARLRSRKELGHYNTALTMKKKREVLKESFNKIAKQTLGSIQLNTELSKLISAILFWTEGGKYTDSHVYFMNSDPILVQTFLKVLRSGFAIDESKFRALVHIHDYHNNDEIRAYWSSLTNIPIQQYYRSYQKDNTGKRIREGYMGCISIRYYDSRIALELRSLYNTFAHNFEG